jgi:glucose 1-dehydrogenase
MRALTVVPNQANSARLDDVPEPANGDVLVATRLIGVCGTDAEIVRGEYGWAPPGKERLIIGHESLGVVIEAPSGSGLVKGDHVVGIVRRPDPVPCANCAVGEWDMCKNGKYTERGIKELDGYASERYRIESRYCVKVDASLGDLGVLLEPCSVVAKAWEEVERIGARAHWQPRVVLVTGAGPIGLLAAMLGVQRGLEVHVLDRVADGPKPRLVKSLGAAYHTGEVRDAGPPPDVVIEATGVPKLVWDAMDRAAPGGIVCLTGVSSGTHALTVDVGALNRAMVLDNNVVVGSVNANRRHYQSAAAALARADKNWLAQLITRRVSLDQWADALARRDDDVKVAIEFS